MSLVSCPHCGKEFRTEPGLAYHLGWAHKTAKTEEPHETNDEDEDVLDFIFGPNDDDEEADEDKDWFDELF